MKYLIRHHRHSIRLKAYDYQRAGLYFITICTQKRVQLFGRVENGTMILNDAGHNVQQCWLDIPIHYPNVILHEYVIMPNHIHGILQIVGANQHSPDELANQHSPESRAKNISPLQRSPSRTIGSVIRGFKIGVTKWMRQYTNVNDVWQRNYYEHIIRDEKSHKTISETIANNPLHWDNDSLA